MECIISRLLQNERLRVERDGARREAEDAKNKVSNCFVWFVSALSPYHVWICQTGYQRINFMMLLLLEHTM